MRRQIDGVVPTFEEFTSWSAEPWCQVLPPGLQLAFWPVAGVSVKQPAGLCWDSASGAVLSRAAPYWLGYDICLLPVRPETLGWTRLALANAAAVDLPPILVVAQDTGHGPIGDLLRLGAADFLLAPFAPAELWLRIVRVVMQQRSGQRPVAVPTLAEPTLTSLDPPAETAAQTLIRQMVQRLAAPVPDEESFRESRDRLLNSFEREYAATMLRRYGGNVTHAARASQQTRRSFWRLMHKHQLAAADFRRGGQRQTADSACRQAG